MKPPNRGLVAARETGVQYSVADRATSCHSDRCRWRDRLQDRHRALASPERANWRDLIPHRQGIYLIDIELYAGHLVRLERANALPSIVNPRSQ